MAYTVNEIFYSLQGEGAQTGRAAVFCRFAGCNLWSGREEDRAQADCTFCDTDFVGGDRFADAVALADAVADTWQGGGDRRFVVLTGGEPLLQVDAALTVALHARGFEIAVETNGTLALPDGIDWVCVSPKGAEPLALTAGDELKLVYPQPEPEAQSENFEGMDFGVFFLQPMDGPDVQAHKIAAVDYCKTHPKWKLSLQTHKILGIP